MVQFGQVEIREYSITIGDNPSCSSGCPISLDWNYDEHLVQLSLDQFEECRVDERRSRLQIKMPAEVRYQILREWNVPLSEIMIVQKQCEEIRNERRRSCENHCLWIMVSRSFKDNMKQTNDTFKARISRIKKFLCGGNGNVRRTKHPPPMKRTKTIDNNMALLALE